METHAGRLTEASKVTWHKRFLTGDSERNVPAGNLDVFSGVKEGIRSRGTVTRRARGTVPGTYGSLDYELESWGRCSRNRNCGAIIRPWPDNAEANRRAAPLGRWQMSGRAECWELWGVPPSLVLVLFRVSVTLLLLHSFFCD